MQPAIPTDESFKGLAFPVVKVRYAGPTDYRGSRWIASLGRMGYDDPTYRTTGSYHHALPSGSVNALPVARECLKKALAAHGDNDAADYVAVPGSLDADTYVFTFVPKYFFESKD